MLGCIIAISILLFFSVFESYINKEIRIGVPTKK